MLSLRGPVVVPMVLFVFAKYPLSGLLVDQPVVVALLVLSSPESFQSSVTPSRHAYVIMRVVLRCERGLT